MQLFFPVEEIAERELKLARAHPLGLVAVDAPLEQRVFFSQVDDRLLERLDARLALGETCPETNDLDLQGRDQRSELFRRQLRRRFVGTRARHLTSGALPAFQGKVFEPSASIARFSTALPSTYLTLDATFDGPLPTYIPSQVTVTVDRYALGAPSPVKYASVGWMFAVALGRGLRRWRRR